MTSSAGKKLRSPRVQSRTPVGVSVIVRQTGKRAKATAVTDVDAMSTQKARHLAITRQAIRAARAARRANDDRSSSRDTDRGSIVIDIRNTEASTGMSVTMRFGSVVASNTAPDAAAVATNIRAGRDALHRAKGAFLTRGIHIPRGNGVPLFHVDATNPAVLIRELDGRSERGRIVDGAFVAAD